MRWDTPLCHMIDTDEGCVKDRVRVLHAYVMVVNDRYTEQQKQQLEHMMLMQRQLVLRILLPLLLICQSFKF